jgi:hypothetical protein
MPLPHFNTMLPVEPDPIMSNLFDTIAIFEDDRHLLLNIEKLDILNDIITCRIKNRKEYSYSEIVKTKILLLEYFDRNGYIIKYDIFTVKNIEYKSSLDRNESKILIIDAKFKIEESKTLNNDMLERDSMNYTLAKD